jgi:AraC-like DNA-binding protein
MRPWTLYRDVEVGADGDTIIQLADVLTSIDVLSSDNGLVLSEANDEFARGRYRAHTVRPLMQYIDCDFEVITQHHLKVEQPPGLCVGVLLKGEWTSIANGKSFCMRKVGIPMIMGAGETYEAAVGQAPGVRCRMAGLYMSPDFFTSEKDEDFFVAFADLLKPNVCFQEIHTCPMLRQILQRLYDNPYRGAMARLYSESLALSAIVELGNHLYGTCIHQKNQRSRHTPALEARAMIDRDLGTPPSVLELARAIGTSEVTLRRNFKAAFGVTIFEYVRGRNLEAARLMLREGHLQVSEVGYRVGYSDPANFTNAYRRRFGRPPTMDAKTS